jgi:hypothetical protein
MANLALTTHFAFGRFGAFANLDIPAYVSVLVTFLTFGASELRKVVCELTAKVFYAGISGRMAALARGAIAIASTGGSHASHGLAAPSIQIAGRACAIRIGNAVRAHIHRRTLHHLHGRGGAAWVFGAVAVLQVAIVIATTGSCAGIEAIATPAKAQCWAFRINSALATDAAAKIARRTTDIIVDVASIAVGAVLIVTAFARFADAINAITPTVAPASETMSVIDRLLVVCRNAACRQVARVRGNPGVAARTANQGKEESRKG